MQTKATVKNTIANVLWTRHGIDGYNDLFIYYFDCKTCPKYLNDYWIDTTASGQTDIPRTRKGVVGVLLLNFFGKEKTLDSYLQALHLFYRIKDKYSADL